MLTAHFRAGPILRPYAPSPDEEALRELFFFDMLEAGIYLARRGMVALSLPVGAADLDRFVAAVSEFRAGARSAAAGGRTRHSVLNGIAERHYDTTDAR